jgi:tetratricopeptide (TPR) repeat protein
MTNNETLKVLMDEGIKLHYEEKHAEACAAFVRAVRFAESSWGPDAREVLKPVVFLPMAVGEVEAGGQDRIAEVLDLERRAVGIVQGQFGEDSPWMAFVLEKIELTLEQLGKHEEAHERLERALAIYDTAYGDAPRTSRCLQNLGSFLLTMDRPADALPHFERALRIEQAHGQNTIGEMVASDGLALCMSGVARTEEAIFHFERALAIRIARRPPEFKGEDAISKELRRLIAEARAKL